MQAKRSLGEQLQEEQALKEFHRKLKAAYRKACHKAKTQKENKRRVK